MTELFRWRPYHFELFGLSCEVFADADPAILIDPSLPNTGYFSQTLADCSLIVSYGPEAIFDEWLKQRLEMNGRRAQLVQPPQVIEFCGQKAEQAVLKVKPGPVAIGSRPTKEGRITIHGGDTGPYLFKMIGVFHRQTPLVVAFKRPAVKEPSYQTAEAHFFESFRLEMG